MLQLAFLMLVSMTSAPREDPFLDLPFDAALEQARGSGKIVLVDFFTTWCAPCKKLDQVTWKDAQVRSWLAEHTVPLKIDAEKETELAARYGIQGYPSLAFIRPDGSLRDVVVGFKEPKEFLALAGDILAGKGVLDLARERLAENKDDFEARLDLARELVNHAQYPEALEHFLWCWDHGLEKNPSQVGVRGSFLLGDVARLGARYPEALKALRDRRDACRAILLDGKGDLHKARDLASLNKALDEGADTLRVYDALADLRPDDPDLAGMRRSMFSRVSDLLLEARRYQDFLDGVGDVEKAIEERIRRSEAEIDLLKGKAEAVGDPQLLGMVKRRVTMEGAKVYEALLGVDRRAEAEKVSARLLELDSSYAAFETLAKHATRAGAPETVEQLLVAAQPKLSESEYRRLERSVERARDK